MNEVELIVIRPTANGWIVTNDTGYLSSCQVRECHVFERWESLTSYIAQLLNPDKYFAVSTGKLEKQTSNKNKGR